MHVTFVWVRGTGCSGQLLRDSSCCLLLLTLTPALPPPLCSPLRSPCGTSPRRRPEEVSVPSHRSAPSSVIWILCGCARSGRPIKQQGHFHISILAAVSARRSLRSFSGREVAGTGWSRTFESPGVEPAGAVERYF